MKSVVKLACSLFQSNTTRQSDQQQSKTLESTARKFSRPQGVDKQGISIILAVLSTSFSHFHIRPRRRLLSSFFITA